MSSIQQSTSHFLEELSDEDRLALREGLQSLADIVSAKEAARPDMGRPGEDLSPRQIEALKVAFSGVNLSEWISEFQARLAKTFAAKGEREREQIFNRLQRIMSDQNLTELTAYKIPNSDALDPRAKLTDQGARVLGQLRENPYRRGKKSTFVAAPAHIDAGKGILFSIVASVLALGVCFIGAGIWLMYLGATGRTQIAILGSVVHSENVGIASIFCGAVVVAMTFRSVMRTLVDLGKIKE